MSIYICYFETKNVTSTNYKGFSAVGNFLVPRSIYGGRESVEYKGKTHKSEIIMDLGGQCAADYFSPHGSESKKVLYDFIESRLNNDCIVSCLVSHIDGEIKRKIEKTLEVTLDKLMNTLEALRNGTCIEISTNYP